MKNTVAFFLASLTILTMAMPNIRAQDKTVLVERGKLVTLAAEAEKAELYKQENLMLLGQNQYISEKLKSATTQLSDTEAELTEYQKKWRYAVMVIVVLGAFCIAIIIKK